MCSTIENLLHVSLTEAPTIHPLNIWTSSSSISGFPNGVGGEEPTCQCRRCKRLGFDPRVGKIPWRRTWQHAPVFLPEKPQRQRSLAGYSPWATESRTRLSRTRPRYLVWICQHVSWCARLGCLFKKGTKPFGLDTTLRLFAGIAAGRSAGCYHRSRFYL